MAEHGGTRPGAGRKPSIYGPTAAIRVPKACLKTIKALISEYKKRFN